MIMVFSRNTQETLNWHDLCIRKTKEILELTKHRKTQHIVFNYSSWNAIYSVNS